MRLGKEYGVYSGNRFRVVYYRLPGEPERRVDVRVRAGRHGDHETRAAEIKRRALDQVARINPDFFERKGVIHPIRASEGYDPSVDEIQRRIRGEQEQARQYSGIKRERFGRLEGGVDRPPWAGTLSDAQLLRIAREHGQRATTEGWWERAHLHQGSGELRSLLREGAQRGERGHKGTSAAAVATEGRYALKRGRVTSAQRRSARGDYSDLPW